jgi:hypothetical protein
MDVTSLLQCSTPFSLFKGELEEQCEALTKSLKHLHKIITAQRVIKKEEQLSNHVSRWQTNSCESHTAEAEVGRARQGYLSGKFCGTHTCEYCTPLGKDTVFPMVFHRLLMKFRGLLETHSWYHGFPSMYVVYNIDILYVIAIHLFTLIYL